MRGKKLYTMRNLLEVDEKQNNAASKATEWKVIENLCVEFLIVVVMSTGKWNENIRLVKTFYRNCAGSSSNNTCVGDTQRWLLLLNTMIFVFAASREIFLLALSHVLKKERSRVIVKLSVVLQVGITGKIPDFQEFQTWMKVIYVK